MRNTHNERRDRRDYSHDSKGNDGFGKQDMSSVNFKMLCPAARVGSVIGKGGEVVKQIRHLSGALVKVVEGNRNDERIVLVQSDEGMEAPICPAQDAMLRVLARIVELELPDGSYETPINAEARLLVNSQFVKVMLGKGGSTLTSIRKTSGARIKVLRKEEITEDIPNEDGDELINVSGLYDQVKGALLQLTSHMRDVVARNKDIDLSRVATSIPVFEVPYRDVAMNSIMSRSDTELPPISMDPVEVAFKLLIPDIRIGTVIGRGGENVKMLRAQTSARVLIPDAVHGCTERLVILSSNEPADDNFCAAIDAMLRCVEIMLTERPPERDVDVVRLLVPYNQASMVLSKDISRQIRHNTGANISLLPMNKTPLCGRPDEGVLEVSGRISQLLAGLRAAAELLRMDIVSMQGMMPPLVGNISAVSMPLIQSPPPAVPFSRHSGGGDLGGSRGHDFSEPSRKRQRDYDPLQDSLEPYQSGTVKDRSCTCVAKLTIPQEVVGTLLGPSGAHIKKIRKISGARVKLFDTQARTGEREVEVAGNLDESQSALSVISRLLRTGAMPDEVIPSFQSGFGLGPIGGY